MNTDKLLKMLLEAIDYSFLQTDGSYDKTLTYPVIDKIKYIKEQVKDIEVKEPDINKEISQFIDVNFKKATIGHKLSLRRVAKYFFELGLKAKDK